MTLDLLGKRIKYFREMKEISQAQLSERTGIVREQISRIENGQVNFTVGTLDKISRAFSVRLSELVDIELENEVKIKKIETKPFVKWAGGKKQIISKLLALLPKNYGTYFEPFVGGGALFFELQPKYAFINDVNLDLIAVYTSFKNEIDFTHMIEELEIHQMNHDEAYYYKIREMDRQSNFLEIPQYSKAARMLYLNKACFNGLYRVNSKGFFNVPSGKKESVKAFDPTNFNNIRQYFESNEVVIQSFDFEKAVEKAKSGDFVYFDPPYDSFEEQTNFTSYDKGDFGKAEQIRLAKVFKELDKKGVYVMLSNHNTKFINELYEGFNINVTLARRMINSNPNGRGKVEEVIITNYNV